MGFINFLILCSWVCCCIMFSFFKRILQDSIGLLFVQKSENLSIKRIGRRRQKISMQEPPYPLFLELGFLQNHYFHHTNLIKTISLRRNFMGKKEECLEFQQPYLGGLSQSDEQYYTLVADLGSHSKIEPLGVQQAMEGWKQQLRSCVNSGLIQVNHETSSLFLLAANDACGSGGQKRKQNKPPDTDTLVDKTEKKQKVCYIGSLCPHFPARNINRNTYYLITKQTATSVSTVTNVYERTTSLRRDEILLNCTFVAHDIEGWLLLLRPNMLSLFFFNLVSGRTIQLLTLPEPIEANCKGNFDGDPRDPNTIVVMMTGTRILVKRRENSIDVWIIHQFNTDPPIDGPIFYHDNIIWVSHGEVVHIANQRGDHRRVELNELGVGETSIFIRQGSLYVINCFVAGESAQIARFDLNANPDLYSLNGYEIVEQIAPYDIFLVPGKEGISVYNPYDDDFGNSLFVATHLDHHLHMYRFHGSEVIERHGFRV